MAVGACGCSGGIFGQNYASRGAVDQVLPLALRVQEERLARLTTSKINQVIQNAQVSVSVTEARARTFSILGAVTAPGQYAILNSEFRVLDALVLARDDPAAQAHHPPDVCRGH